MSFVIFPHNSVGKEYACNAGDMGSVPGLGRSPGQGKGYPLQYSGLENSMNYIVHGAPKSWAWLSHFHFHFCYINEMTFVKLVRMGAGCQRNQPPEWRAGNLSPSPTAPRTGGGGGWVQSPVTTGLVNHAYVKEASIKSPKDRVWVNLGEFTSMVNSWRFG